MNAMEEQEATLRVMRNISELETGEQKSNHMEIIMVCKIDHLKD